MRIWRLTKAWAAALEAHPLYLKHLGVTAMLQSVAVPGSTAVPSSQVLDEEGQQHYEVQQHAAAVQLLNRSLAVAHLRAEMIKPK